MDATPMLDAHLLSTSLEDRFTRTDSRVLLNGTQALVRLLLEQAGMDDASARSGLIELLGKWSELLQLPRLGRYGISESDFPLIVANSRGSSMQTNPIVLTDPEIQAILAQRI